MGLIARTLILSGAVAGGLASSQLPEFSQQYQQRLGGAIDELRAVVADFDADAARNGLQRDEAIVIYRQSAEEFLRDRGQSMSQTLSRFESLIAQRERFARWPDMAEPLAIARQNDATLLAGTWDDFRPAVPVTVAGGLYAAGGGLLGWGLIALLMALVASTFRPRIRPSPADQSGSAGHGKT